MIAIGYQNIFQFLENSIGKYFILLGLITVSYAFASIWAKLKLTHLPLLNCCSRNGDDERNVNTITFCNNES